MNGVVRTAVPGATRLYLRKLASLTGLIASEGWWTAKDMRNFAELAAHILYECNPGDPYEETNIFPTPESEASETGCTEFQYMRIGR